MEVYPIWLCPHRLFKLPLKTMVYPEPGFEVHHRQGDTHSTQMYTGPVNRGRGVGWSRGSSLYGALTSGVCLMLHLTSTAGKKYGAMGTFTSVYYKSKKGRKTWEGERAPTSPMSHPQR